jgi:uncharacterized membrane protein
MMFLASWRVNLRNIYIRLLIALFLFLGSLLLFLGLSGLLFPDYLFNRLFLPLSRIFSQTGQFRSDATIQMLYREWLNVGIYIINIIGIISFAFSIIWNSLENKAREEVRMANPKVEPKKDESRWFYLYALISITVLGAILRAVNLNQSFWGDEIIAITDFVKPYRFWRYIELADHLLYTFFGLLSLRLFGESEIAFRMPAYLFGVLTIPALYYSAQCLFTKKEALIATILLCVSAFHIQYSNEARGYSALALLSLVSSLLFLKIIIQTHPEKLNKKEIIAFCALTVMGLLSHFYYIWVLFAQFFTTISIVALKRSARNKNAYILTASTASNLFAAMVSGLLLTFLIYGPEFTTAFLHKYIGWKGAGEAVSLKAVSYLFTGNQIIGLGIGFSVLILFSLLNLWQNRRFILVIYCIFLFIFPFLMVKIICKNAFTRYFIYSLPFLMILLAHIMVIVSDKFSYFGKWIILTVFILTFTVLQAPALAHYYRNYQAGLEDHRRVGRLIDKLAGDDEIVSAIGLSNQQAQYYIKKHRVIYLSDQELRRQLESSDRRVWLIVTFPDFLYLYPEALRTHKLARERLKLIGHFPSAYSDIILYVSKVK